MAPACRVASEHEQNSVREPKFLKSPTFDVYIRVRLHKRDSAKAACIDCTIGLHKTPTRSRKHLGHQQMRQKIGCPKQYISHHSDHGLVSQLHASFPACWIRAKICIQCPACSRLQESAAGIQSIPFATCCWSHSACTMPVSPTVRSTFTSQLVAAGGVSESNSADPIQCCRRMAGIVIGPHVDGQMCKRL